MHLNMLALSVLCALGIENGRRLSSKECELASINLYERIKDQRRGS